MRVVGDVVENETAKPTSTYVALRSSIASITVTGGASSRPNSVASKIFSILMPLVVITVDSPLTASTNRTRALRRSSSASALETFGPGFENQSLSNSTSVLDFRSSPIARPRSTISAGITVVGFIVLPNRAS